MQNKLSINSWPEWRADKNQPRLAQLERGASAHKVHRLAPCHGLSLPLAYIQTRTKELKISTMTSKTLASTTRPPAIIHRRRTNWSPRHAILLLLNFLKNNQKKTPPIRKKPKGSQDLAPNWALRCHCDAEKIETGIRVRRQLARRRGGGRRRALEANSLAIEWRRRACYWQWVLCMGWH
jgi:hypothetical protein